MSIYYFKTDLVVVVPKASHQLISPGYLGALPPLMCRFSLDEEKWYRDGYNYWDRKDAGVVESGLPLWWNGALVPEGWDRFRREIFIKNPMMMGGIDLWSKFNPNLNQLIDSVNYATAVYPDLISRVVIQVSE